jgi:TPR repeat protein
VARDVNKGTFWLDKAAQQGQTNAQIALANYLLRPGADGADRARGVALLEKAVESGSRDGHLYLAAALAAGQDAALRNPARALDLISVLGNIEDEPAAFEVRAAANAMLGQFTEAQADQKKAMVAARKRRWDPAPLQARLDRYVARQAWTGELMLY